MERKPISATFPTASEEFKNATGPIRYQMTNDYMFHAALQQNPRVLKGLICALLGLHPEEIRSVQVMNPIKLGEAIGEKNFILDINILLNDNAIMNLEMQVAYIKNWVDRSLSYLCRSFDQLQKGEDYDMIKPVIHIGFLDFTPFKEDPEFYASYKLMNVKNHHVYSDKLELRVVDLTKISLATEEDKACRLDDWARLFKATTWEEIKMIAKNDTELNEASETLYTLNADYLVRKQCEARADYYRLQNSINREMDEMARKIREMDIVAQNMATKNQNLALENENLVTENENLVAENENLVTENENLVAENENLVAENGNLVTENGNLVAENENLVTENGNLVAENENLVTKNQNLASKNQDLIRENNEKDMLIAQLKARLS